MTTEERLEKEMQRHWMFETFRDGFAAFLLAQLLMLASVMVGFPPPISLGQIIISTIISLVGCVASLQLMSRSATRMMTLTFVAALSREF